MTVKIDKGSAGTDSASIFFGFEQKPVYLNFEKCEYLHKKNTFDINLKLIKYNHLRFNEFKFMNEVSFPWLLTWFSGSIHLKTLKFCIALSSDINLSLINGRHSITCHRTFSHSKKLYLAEQFQDRWSIITSIGQSIQSSTVTLSRRNKNSRIN